MPRIDATLFERLFDGCGTAAVPRAGDHLHPLHAVYDRHAARKSADRTLATGSRRLYDFLNRVDPVVVDVEDDTAADTDVVPFADVDTRSDLVAVAAAIDG